MSWSKKYKKSIDCSNPKGFSQKAHCAGRKVRKRSDKTVSKSINERKMKLNKKEKKLFIETHDKWLKEGKFLAKLFTRSVEKAISKNPNINRAINKADDAILDARKEIEKNLNGDQEKIKKAIPLSVRKYLGFDY